MPGSRRLPEGPAPEPAVQKLRVRYAKRGRMRFTSTRDFQRALERAVRRAGLPMAFSGGFHPHPKISYANAAPTGTASEAEFVEISLTRAVDPSSVVAELDAALPEGLDVIDVADAADLPGALADHLQASRWRMTFRGAGESGDAAGDRLDAAVRAFLDAPEVLVTRTMKKGPRELDVRAAVADLVVERGAGPDAEVLAVVRHTTPTVRPEELWLALRFLGAEDLSRPVSTRLAQGPLIDVEGVARVGELGEGR